MVDVYKNILLSNNNNEWGCAAIDVYKKIICDIVLEFEQLGYNPIDKMLITIVHSPYNYPMCSTIGDSRVIFLITKDNLWSQLSYQFAHEYCHHLIDGPMDGETCSSFWFEEAVCELSSIYFMRRIAQKWIDNAIPILNDYATHIMKYCEDNWSDVPHIDNLSSWLQDNESVLSESKYHRDLYKVIAKSLYPLFEKHPSIWKLLPYLKRVSQEEYVSFRHWITDIVASSIPDVLLDCFNYLKEEIIAE